jgi:hypothetical protein
MAGLLGNLLVGAAQGYGMGVVEQARAKRAQALEDLRHQRAMEVARMGQDFQRSEREASQAFALENRQGDLVDLGGGKYGVRQGTTVQPLRNADGSEVTVQPRAGFRPLTDAEKRAAGIDPKVPAQIGPDGEIKTIGGSGTNIRVDTGTIPAGYRAVRDADGNIMQIEPRPGSPAAAEADKIAASEKNRDQGSKQRASLVAEEIDRALQVMDSGFLPSTGMGGKLAGIPGTNAKALSSLLDTIKANIGFDELNKMRQQSPTGGALGNVTERELAFLQSVAGSLDQEQSDEQLRYNLNRLWNAFQDTVHGAEGGPERRALDYSPAKAGSEAPKPGTIEEGYRFKGGDPANRANWEKVQ